MASLAFSALLTFGLTAPAAHAGSYTDVQSGDKTPATVTPPADANPAPLGPYDAVATSAVTPHSPDGDPTYTIKVNPGAITDTFTWTHGKNPDGTTQTDADDPPPTCVLMEQTSSATWFVRMENGTGTGSGTPDCGLPKGTVTTGTYGQANGPSSALRATLCTQQSGSSFSASCSPTASFTGTTGADGLVSGEATVSGGATVYPITLTVSGTKPDSSGNPDVLTGQQITATLSGIPTNYTVTKYTWSGVSATCFKTYNEKAASSQLTPLGDADKSGTATGNNMVPALAFYDSAADSLTVTCTVTVLAPDGKATVTLTATAPAVTVLKPTLMHWDILTGYVQHAQDSTGQGGYQLRQPPTSTQAGGEAWQKATIVVPAPFTATGGMGCFAQLVTPDIEFTNDTPSKVPVDPTNKQQGLDNSFPYQGDMWNVSGLGAGFDSPALIYENLNSGTYAGWTQVSDSNTFTTWVMYQPPGGVWVPLQSYDWDWSFTSQWDKTAGKWNPFRARPSKTSGDPGYTGMVTTTFPQWKLVQNNASAPSK